MEPNPGNVTAKVVVTFTLTIKTSGTVKGSSVIELG